MRHDRWEGKDLFKKLDGKSFSEILDFYLNRLGKVALFAAIVYIALKVG